MADGGFAIYQRNLDTGGPMGRLIGGLTEQQVADWLSGHTGFDAVKVTGFIVGHPDGGGQTAAEFLTRHGTEAVKAAWMAGAPAARRARQRKLEDWWPALASALNLMMISELSEDDDA